MSRRNSSTKTKSKRLQSRAERTAARPSATPDARRSRQPQKVPTSGGLSFLPGFLGTVSPFAIFGAIIVVVLGGWLIYSVIQANSTGSTTPSWVKAAANSDPNIPGVYIKPNPGADGKYDEDTNPNSDDRAHFGPGVKYPICSQDAIDKDNAITDIHADRSGVSTCYNSNPPTSGPHDNPGPMPWKVLDNPAPKENLVHNMEHGGVVIWYNTDNKDVISQLAKITNDNIDRRKEVVMSKYVDMEPDTIAVSSWTRLDKFSVSDFSSDNAAKKKEIQHFIDVNERRFNPEGF